MNRILPDEYENFCRNPDENPLGPWCFVSNELKSPCFEPCRLSTETSSEFICLNRDGFPYTKYDMSDVLDLPQLIAVFENVHLMYESRYVLPFEVKRLSTKSCINTGPIAKRFGPWIAVLNEAAKEFIKTVGRKVLRELCVPPEDDSSPLTYKQEVFLDGIAEDELTVSDCSFWRRCFSSCQDDMTTCWQTDRTSYFGIKSTTVTGKNCMPWTQVSSEILRMQKANSSSVMYQLYFDILFKDPEQRFIESKLFLNTESSCMLLSRRDETDKNKSFEDNPHYSKEIWDLEYNKMFEKGPGCFVKNVMFSVNQSTISQCQI
uniref:Kringle domain-containing protein n=1 Tax=Caenorhabditis tropicalis TaxID=1561998 RepID=A0A1I7T8S8_9PELO